MEPRSSQQATLVPPLLCQQLLAGVGTQCLLLGYLQGYRQRLRLSLTASSLFHHAR